MNRIETAGRDDLSAILAVPRPRLIEALALGRWLLDDARYIPDPTEVVAGIAERLNRAGVPVDRLASYVEARHSQRAGVAHVWRPDVASETLALLHDDIDRLGQQASPFTAVIETGQPLEIDLVAAPDDLFPIVPELKAEGYRGYYCFPARLANGMEAAVAFATKRTGGFDADDHTVVEFIKPATVALIEILVTRRTLNDVTRIYIGSEPSRLVLSGDTRRGNLVTIDSAIMFADMRGFTTHSMRLPMAETVHLLNAYYDCVVAPVEERGGEVLKFIGDGVLAIFRVDGDGTGALGRALAASRAALAEVERINRDGGAPAKFEIGIGLHLGEAGYGNVGSGERQDYTIIGRDVNLASRVAGLCGMLKRPLLLSEPAVHKLGGGFTALGDYPLKGIDGERTIYAPSG